MNDEIKSLINSISELYEVKYSLVLSNKILDTCKSKEDIKKCENSEIINEFKKTLSSLNELSEYISNTFKYELDL